MAASADALRVSRPGTLTAVTVVAGSKEPFTVVSVSAMWERPLDTEGPIWADASAYRLLSVPTPLIGGRLPLLISGDWNILRGHGEQGDKYVRHYGHSSPGPCSQPWDAPVIGTSG